MTENSTYYTKHIILTSSHHITYTNDNCEKKHSYIYNLFKITASTNVTEQNPKMLKYPIETDNFLSNVII